MLPPPCHSATCIICSRYREYSTEYRYYVLRSSIDYGIDSIPEYVRSTLDLDQTLSIYIYSLYIHTLNRLPIRLCRQFRCQSGRWFNPTGANENRALLIPNRVAYKMAVPSLLLLLLLSSLSSTLL